jgi:hypothetical protein
MAYLLTHPKFDQEVQLSDIGDGAYRALLGSMFYAIDNHTNWSVPVRDISTVSPTYTLSARDELETAGWWIHLHDDILLAVAGPRDREVLMRRCQSDRAPITTEVRQHVYERDGFSCVECASREDLTLDHIWPWSRGGTDEPSNLRALCRSCNSRKGAKV